MKETTKTSRIAGYLEKMFREINKDSFGGELEEPIITIMSTPGAYGHVTIAKVWKRKDEDRHELNISADWLTRPIENVVATLIHEMVHIYNLQHDIQDTSRGGSYHNKKFKEEAEKHMLHIEKSEKYGWTITEVTDELLEYILSKGWEDIQTGRGFGWVFRGTGGGKNGTGAAGKPDGDTEKGKPKGNSRRYVCPGCGLIARTTKDARLFCGGCDEEMELKN